MSGRIRIKIRKYSQDGAKHGFFSVLIFDPQKESLASLTQMIRDKLGGLPASHKMLMFADGGVIDDIAVILMDDKIEILSREQEEDLLKTCDSHIDSNSLKSFQCQEKNINLEDTQMTLVDEQEPE
jgi:hypothetical protein